MRIVFCIPGNNFNRRFLESWTLLFAECTARGYEVILSQRYDSVVHYARTKCIGGVSLAGVNQKPFQGNLDYDVMMWIDSDVIFRPCDFFTLLESPHPVTCGMYSMANGKNYPMIKKWDHEYYLENGSYEFYEIEEIERLNETKFPGYPYLEVPYCGMGWFMIKKGVLEKIEYPWFYHEPFTHTKPDGTVIKEMFSEDVSLCKRLSAAGIPIMVDTRIRVGHLKELVL
jgi:hypothetical protein